MTFATTTDGNHGRGVAWAARALGQKAVVYMPKGSAQERVNHITGLGAECIVTDMNYDDTVRLTMENAKNTAGSWFRIPPAKDTPRSRPGLCRATPHWLPKRLPR